MKTLRKITKSDLAHILSIAKVDFANNPSEVVEEWFARNLNNYYGMDLFQFDDFLFWYLIGTVSSKDVRALRALARKKYRQLHDKQFTDKISKVLGE